MDSGSQSDKPPHPSSQFFAHVIGTAIAVVTLVTPFIAIAAFSSQNNDVLRSPPYTIMNQHR